MTYQDWRDLKARDDRMFERQRRAREQMRFQTLALIWMAGAILAALASFVAAIMVMPVLMGVCMTGCICAAAWSCRCALKGGALMKGSTQSFERSTNHLRGILYSEGDGRLFMWSRGLKERVYLDQWQMFDRFHFDKDCGRKTRVRVQARHYGDIGPI